MRIYGQQPVRKHENTMTGRTSLHAVFFDFDGVIADSLAVKRAAIAALFAPYGNAVRDAALAYHVANGGMPRREKLRHCLERLAGQAADEAVLAEMDQAFARLVFQGVVAAPLLPGVMSALQALRQARVPAFVVSGTPEEEMRAIVRHRELAPYFQGVFGSPRPKGDIVGQILRQAPYTPSHCLFIGDALADWRAARECGLAFLGIVSPGQNNIFPAGTAVAPDPGMRHWPRLLGQRFSIP